MFLLLVFLLPTVLAQQCNYNSDKRTYFCTQISETFPAKFYGNYHLRCTSCRIPNYTNRTFPHDNTLISFDLRSSFIRTLSQYAFTPLQNVQYLRLQKNHLATIPENAFNGLRQLFELHLEENQLKKLEKGFLAEVQANEVSLGGNQLEEIPEGVFVNSRGILGLDLSYNKVRLLHQGSFDFLDGLEVLDLEGNDLCYIPLGVFRNLSTLKKLNLARNKISRLTIGSFSGLKNLQFLNLSSNAFTEFEDGSLLAFNQITQLDLSKNGLNFLDAVTLHSSAPSLRSLMIDDNLWSCGTLRNLVQYLRSIRVDVVNSVQRYSVPNIYGIACSEVFVKEKVEFGKFMQAVEEDAKKYVNYC